MAQQLANKNGVGLTPSNYTEQRAPQFVGGSTDPDTGNLVASSKSQAAIAASSPDPVPAAPTTRLGDMSANSTNGITSAIGGAALNVGSQLAVKALGNSVTTKPTDVGNNGGNPVDNIPIGGYGVDTKGSSYDESGFKGFASSPPGAYDNLPNVNNVDLSYLDKTPSAPPSAPAPSYSPPASSGGGYSGGDSGAGEATADSVICTELRRQGLLDANTYRADQRFGAVTRQRHPEVYAGYMVWAPYVVKLMRRSPRITSIVTWVAKPWTETMAIQMGENGIPTVRGLITFRVAFALCGLIGRIAARRAARVMARA